ncbi:MAG: signal peptidase II [Acidimicrobiia bacterium]
MTRRYLLAGGIAGVVVTADLFTKRLATISFVDERVDVIPGFLEFTYHENPGAAFSLFQSGGQFLAVAAFVIVGILLFSLRIERPTIETVAYGFVMGGALGNLADRVFRGDGWLDGSVIDWIGLSVIPTFNIADASITVAVALLVIGAWTHR